MTEQERKNCFIIMPFSDTKSHDKNYWDGHYKYLESLLSVFPLRIHRSEVFFASRNSPLLQNIFPSTGGEN